MAGRGTARVLVPGVSRPFLSRHVSFGGRRIAIPSASAVRSWRTRRGGRPAGARLPKGRTARLPRALPQKVGRRDGGNDGSVDGESVSLRISRDEQRRAAPLQHAARATSRGATEHAAASEDKFGA